MITALSIAAAAVLVLSSSALAAQVWSAQQTSRPRVVVTTDAEIDDRCSMNRFLLYTNEWETCGLIFSSSVYHHKGNASVPAHRWEGEEWLQRQLDAYASVYPNLKLHDKRYPTPEHLRKQVFLGNVDTVGDMAAPTPGSERIVELLLDQDPTPIWLQAWGGPNTIARALKTIEEQHAARKAEVSRKAVLFLITEQDKTYREYIRPNWPGLQVVISEAFPAIAYDWRDLMEPELQRYFDGAWMRRNITREHGPLCAMYETHGDGAFISEGDSPAYLHLLSPGLGAAEHPGNGGWGGRFAWNGDHWASASDDRDPYSPILRWAEAIQNDWASRADWCVKPVKDANHPPRVVLGRDRTTRVVHRTVSPGESVRLSAQGTTDPDGDALTYRWWVYKEAGDFWGEVRVGGDNGPEAVVSVPALASGRTLHIILEVRDDGDPPLTAYRRVVLHVSGKPEPMPPGSEPNARYLDTPIRELGGPPESTGPWEFARGINVNGPPTVIDGNRWDGDDAQGFACTDAPLNVPDAALRPQTDTARAAMIRSFRWSGQARATVSGLAPGEYAVYVYVWEDNRPEILSLLIDDQVVVRRHVSGVSGEWHRLGPFPVVVRDGSLRLATRGGAANLSGIEIWRKRGRP